MNTITRGIRNAFRNTIRTVAIVIIVGLSIGLALTMLVARQAVQQKINSVKSSIGNTISVAPAGVRGFEGGGNPLTDTEMNMVQALPHVTSVVDSISDRLNSTDTNLQSSITAGSLGQRFGQFNSQGGGGGNVQVFTGGGGGSSFNPANFTPPVTVVGTTNAAQLDQTLGGGTLKITSGTTINGAVDKDVAIVGSALASKNSLKVGSTFTAYNTTITVQGIFDAGNTFSNAQLVMPLATVQRLSGQSGDITSAVITVDSVSNLSSVTSAVQKTLGSAADVTSSQQAAANAIAPLNSVKTVSLYSLIGAVIAGAVIILLTMIMIARERRREIGVLKAIGASNLKIIGQFMTESITFTVLGAIVGVILGVFAGNPVTKLLVNNTSTSVSTGSAAGPVTTVTTRGGGGFSRALSRLGGSTTTNAIRNIHAAVGWSILLYGFGAALLIAIVGSSLAAGIIARVRPAEVMRTE